jgi:hypothetical protein
MAIILKNSATAAKVPLASDLVAGELAVNTTDGIIYTRKGAGVVGFLWDTAKKASPVLNGLITAGSILVTRAYCEKLVAVTASTATTALDLQAGSAQVVTIAASTSITFTNLPPTVNGEMFAFSIATKNNGTAGFAVSFPANVKWENGQIPPRTTAANANDLWSFFTEDGGTTYYGALADKDYK